MKKATFFLLLSVNISHLFGQVKQPSIPQITNTQPVYGSANFSNNSAPQYQQPNQIKLGGTATDVMNDRNNQTVNSAITQKRQEVEQILNDIRTNQRKFAIIDSITSIASTAHLKRFDDALKHLQDMLAGKVPLSLADAYYTIENAFGNPYLSRAEYDRIIKQSVDFIKNWMQQNGLNPKDNDMLHYAIQKFMSETLTINKTQQKGDKGLSVKPTTHQPFHYDYNDYTGEKDSRDLFLTKCLATGFGQCASMPAVYLVLAESLGAKTYLTFTPQHSFIKYSDNNGNIRNYEPTSNWEISDKWYKDNFFISVKAIETGVYLDTFNTKQIVANCVFDLAVYYTMIDRTGKEDLIVNCLKAGKPYFPKNNNLLPLFLHSQHVKTILRETMRKNKITRFEDIYKSPDAKKLYNEFIETEAYITKLGYQDMPAGMYEDLLQQHEFKGKIQQQYKISGKEKRSLFIEQ